MDPLDDSELKITELENEFLKNKTETLQLFDKTKNIFKLENLNPRRNKPNSSGLSSSLPNNGKEYFTLTFSRNDKRNHNDLYPEKTLSERKQTDIITSGRSYDNNYIRSTYNEEIQLKSK